LDLWMDSSNFLWIKAWLCVDFNFGFTYLLSKSSKDDLQSKWLVQTLCYNDKVRLRHKRLVEILFYHDKVRLSTNDRSKFYFTMIKWDYNTNDRLKLALHEEMSSLMVEEWRWRCTKQQKGPLRVHRVNSKLQNKN